MYAKNKTSVEQFKKKEITSIFAELKTQNILEAVYRNVIRRAQCV